MLYVFVFIAEVDLGKHFGGVQNILGGAEVFGAIYEPGNVVIEANVKNFILIRGVLEISRWVLEF